MPNGEIRIHEEVKKRRDLHDKGFGRVVKGFRTMDDAAAFNRRWANLDVDMIRLMYPMRTAGMNDMHVLAVRQEVFDAVKKRGLQGLADAIGGGLDAVENILKSGVEAASGAFKKGGLPGAAGRLAGEVLLDIYFYGTGPTGVSSFESFVVHRQKKVFGYDSQTDPESRNLWDQILRR